MKYTKKKMWYDHGLKNHILLLIIGWLSLIQVVCSAKIPRSSFVPSLGKTTETIKLSTRKRNIPTPLYMSARTASSYVSSDSDDDNDERTLYEILGASPRDTPSQLKTKYTQKARKYHPDSADFVGHETATAEFTKVVQAWRILQDPKERLRYDRALKLKELEADAMDNVESFIDFGLNVAVPFFKKTADTTIAAVEISSKNINKTAVEFSNTLNDVTYRMENSRERFDIDKKSRDLELQAKREMSLAMKLKSEHDSINSKRLETLINPNIAEMTSSMALQILDGFNKFQYIQADTTTKNNKKTTNDNNNNSNQQLDIYIDGLKEMEQEYAKKMKERQELEKSLATAERNVETALNGETLANQRLEKARLQLEEAGKQIDVCRKTQYEAIVDEKNSLKNLETLTTALKRRQEKARGLGSFIKDETMMKLKDDELYLQQLYKQLDDLVKTLRTQAQRVSDTEWNTAKAIQNEEKAKKQYEQDAKIGVLDAKKNVEATQRIQRDMMQNEKLYEKELETVSNTLLKRQDRVCTSLQNKEDECIQLEKQYLKSEYKRYEDLSKISLDQSKQLQKKSKELEKELIDRERKQNNKKK